MRKNFIKALACAASLALTGMQAAWLPASSAAERPDFSILGAVAPLSAEQTQQVAGIIYDGLASHKDSVSFRSNGVKLLFTEENKQAIMNIYVSVVGGWEVGLLSNKSTTNFVLEGRNEQELYFSKMALYYWVDDADYDAAYQALTGQLDTICEGVDPAWSDAEKALYLHEYLAIHYDYDHYRTGVQQPSTREERLAHTAYGMLTRGEAVCEGYTWLYSLLLRRLGIQNMTVVSDDLSHTWNLVNIGGEWFHADVTWDDYDDKHPGLLTHRSFLQSTDAMRETNHDAGDIRLTTGLSIDEVPTSDRFRDAFWTRTDSAIQYYQGAWLALEPNASDRTDCWFNLYTFDAATGEEHCETLTSQNERWLCFDRPNYYYVDSFIVAAVNSGTIYYTTPKSIMALHNGQHIWICDLTDAQKAEGYIYGLYADRDMLYYSVSKAWADTDAVQYSLPLTADLRSELYERAGEPAWVERNAAYTLPETTAETTTELTTETSAMTETSETTAQATTTTALAAATTTLAATTAAVTTQTTTTTAKATTTTARATTTTTTAAATTTKATTTTTTTSTTQATTTTTTAAATTTTTTQATTTTATTTTTAATTTTTTTTPQPTAAPTEPVAVTADWDGDGVLSVTDVIAFNRYLLGCCPLPEGAELTQFDLCEDGVIDVFDLAMMKRLLLGMM